MRTFIFVFTGLLALISCSDEVRFNAPAFQGIRDTVFFKAQTTRFETKDSGDVVLSGFLGDELVQLQLPRYGEGVFELGPDQQAQASYINRAGRQFSTRSNGEGQVFVERVEDSTFTGTFKFRAVASIDSSEVFFTKGVFYEIPFFGAPVPPEAIPVVETSFLCFINGNRFMPPVVNASAGPNFITGAGGIFAANIRLRFPRSVEPGTYPLSDFVTGGGDYLAAYAVGASDLFVESGTLTIISHNTQEGSVAGTFSFTARSTASVVQITRGEFGFNY